MKNFFTSDYHLSHTNVIKYDNRPFSSIEEMNEFIIDRQNTLVDDKDNFYFLGDFCFNHREAEYWIKQLKGNLFFIKGNHDNKDMIRLYKKYGTFLGEQTKIKIENQDIVLNHYAMRVWNKSHHGAWQLYGHSHGSLPDDPNALSFDVGCMLFDYEPLEFEDVKKIMSNKNYKPVDHHK